MIVLLAFEEEFYRRRRVPATSSVIRWSMRRRFRAARGGPAPARLDPDAPVFALLPGSRSAELRRMLAPLLETARATLVTAPGARFLIPVAPTLDVGAVAEAAARSGLPVVALAGAFDEVAAASDAAVAASGTATLELALRGVRPSWSTRPVLCLTGSGGSSSMSLSSVWST